MLSLIRVLKFAFQDIARNFSLSFMTIFILVLMLLSVNTLVVIRVFTEEATISVKDQIDVSVYFNKEATDDEIKEIREYVSSFPEVVAINFYSKEKNLDNFREQSKDDKELLDALDELDDNPFGSTMVVKTREPRDYNKVIKALSVPEYEDIIQAKTFGDTEKAIERIDIITSQVEKFSIALTILFSVIALLIIFNTVKVAIYDQRKEISIKKLVGASNWFIRGPYIIEAFIFSILSVLITYSLVVLAAGFMDPFVSVVFGKYNLLTDYFKNNIIFLFGLQFASVLFLTVFSSSLAMRKYLRV